MSLQVVAKTRTERRKTIGGIDFELLAASQAGEYKLMRKYRKGHPSTHVGIKLI